jgi:hypothetical protein
MSDRLAHLADLSVSSFPDRNGQVSRTQPLDLSRLGSASIYCDPAGETIQITRVGDADDSGLVHARDPVARVRQLRSKVSVVGQQQQAF